MNRETEIFETGTPKGRILVVDDNRDNAEIISTRLRFRGYEITVAMDGESALAAIRSDSPDLVLLDVMLPDIDGFEISRRVKGDPSLPFTPIILVTARDSTEDKIMGFDAGADDYLTKPINFSELEARVRSMLRIKRLQDMLEEKNRELERLSVSDGLTGLYNHRYILELLHDEFERAGRTGGPLSVAMLDLDRFKSINDSYGHQAGDRVLQQVGEILRGTARDVDRLGRYGGEEFLIILPATDTDGAAIFVERVRTAVEQYGFAVPTSMTVSAGVATYPSDGIFNIETLVRRADEALYAAKAAGRNRIARFDQLDATAGQAP
ncbi:MAG: PleD family two-component system response regulator [Gemmatimonadetes bacterium]|nr:PleD family two-component system response regulator [Gemmatimonadota bacterium]